MSENVSRNSELILPESAKAHVFYHHLHFFRAITILLIVGAHAWIMPLLSYTDDFSIDPQLKLLNSFFQAFFHDGTVLFAFISGLLFTLVLHNNSWKTFFFSKVNNVLLPYIVITFVYTFIQWKLVWVGFSKVDPDNTMGFLSAAITNVPKGLAGFHLWYIPVLFVLFICTPLLKVLVEGKAKIILGIILLAPLLVSREWPYFSWQTVVYFAGAYVLGMIVGAHYKNSLRLIAQYKITLIIAFLLIVTVGLPMLIAKLVKLATGKYSRMVIGS